MKLKEIIKQGVKERQWIIKDLIPQGEITFLYAPTDHYKTFMSIKIALEVITGSQELGATKSGKVRILSAEPSLEDMVLRIRGLANTSYSSAKETILENLELDFDDFDFARGFYKWIPHEEDFWNKDLDPPGWDVRDTKIKYTWEDYGIDKFQHTGHKLLIIDTLSHVIGGNSINDDKAIRVAIKAFKDLIRGSEQSLSVVVIAHAGKNNSKGLMGSSIQKNDVPTVLKIRKKKGNQLELHREKIKSKASGTSIPFKMREIVIDNQETLYVDIGSSLNEFENHIVSSTKLGNSKEETKEILYKLGITNTTTRKSFNTVFNRSWKKLADMGFFSI